MARPAAARVSSLFQKVLSPLALFEKKERDLCPPPPPPKFYNKQSVTQSSVAAAAAALFGLA